MMLPTCPPAEAVIPARASIALEERQRGLELAKYFCAASVLPGKADTHPLTSPKLSPDKTLTALAQLGAFKLNCNRSFISLIDRSFQYIIGEATQSTSLLLDDLHAKSAHDDMHDEDGVYLGFRALELSFGVCPQTIQVFTSDNLGIDTPNVTADRTRYIIRDFTADPKFANRPYVAGWPHMRSYAEVPLTSESGFVIGSYCVVDTKLREFGDADIAALNSVSSCIMEHLELLKTKQEFQRVEGLVRGIGSYVAGYSGLQEQQTRTLPNRTITSHVMEGSGEGQPPKRPLLHSRQSSSWSSSRAQSFPSTLGTSAQESACESIGHGDSSQSTAPSWQDWNQKNEGMMGDISPDIRATFTRAGSLIRQSMQMQGVAFLDARLDGPAFSTGTSKTSHRRSMPLDINSIAPSGLCNVLGYSTETPDDPSTIKFFNIDQSLQRRMLVRYPFGHIFSYDELGVISNPHLRSNHQGRMHPSRSLFQVPDALSAHSEDDDSAALFEASQHARSIVFTPLWDFNKDKWFAATFGWTNDPIRILDISDLDYLSAFGNSIMAEVFRLEASALSRAKSDFMSSVSHELRSPLHGILAGAELLRECQDKISESSLLDTVESCGHTLLDTIDHLLDFAKINSLTNTRRSSGDPRDEPTRLTIVDLGELVQDVVDGVYLGFSAKQPSRNQSITDLPFAAVTTEETKPVRELDNVVVLVNIDPSVDWTFDVESGAWRRIVMNLFANSLKYTTRGQIDVCLDIVTEAENDSSEPTRSVRLVIRDTGKGISKEYIQDRLFTPFAQEDTLTEGTGLGLSIVHRLVASLGGSIDVQSDLGIGTRMSVTIPFGPKTQAISAERRASQPINKVLLDPSRRLKGCKFYTPECETIAKTITDPSSEQPGLEVNGISATRSLFSLIAGQWLGMDVLLEVSSDPTDQSEAPLTYILEHHKQQGRSPTWTVRTESSSTRDFDNAVTIHQPFGPRKLALALAHAIAGTCPPQPTGRPTSIRSVDKPDEEKHEEKEPQVSTEEDLPSSSLTRAPSTHLNTPIPTQPYSPTAPTDPLAPTGSGSHLLLVDDNAINLKVLSTCIRRIGHTFSQAMDGLQALEAFKASLSSSLDQRPFDLIFMDLSMPVMDGCTATRMIREVERHNGLERIPIIALTALGAEQARREALESGLDVFMSKPVKMSEVKGLLERTLGSNMRSNV